MPCITNSNALAERIGASLTIAGAILLAIGISPTLPAFCCLAMGSVILLGVALSQRNSSAAAMQFAFVVINTIGFIINLGGVHA